MARKKKGTNTSKRNKTGQFSDPLSSSKEYHETRGKRHGSRHKGKIVGNSSYRKVQVTIQKGPQKGKRVYRWKLAKGRQKMPRKLGRK